MYRDCDATDRSLYAEFPKLKVLYINTMKWLISYKEVLECCNIKYYRRYGKYV